MPADPRFVHQAFTEIADRYVCANHVLSLGIDVHWRRKLAKLVAEKHPAKLIDLATGSGDLAAEIQKACPGTEIIGADFCAPMLEQAKKRGLKNLIVADAMDLPFAASTFDAVTIGFGLRNLPSFEGGLREMARVLKPGGCLAILDFSLPRWRLIRWPYRLYLERILPLLGGLLTGKPGPYRYLATSIGQFPSGQEMLSLIKQCGFSAARALPVSFGVATIYLAERGGN